MFWPEAAASHVRLYDCPARAAAVATRLTSVTRDGDMRFHENCTAFS